MAGEQSNCEDFCKDYLILNPQKAGVLDVIRLLYSKNVQERSFVDCSEGAKLVDFDRRWIIFISVWVQKALFLGRRLLACTRWLVDAWLNNGGFIKLVLKSLTGRVESPNRYSSNYTSIIAILDPRRDLDPKIKPGDPAYNSELSIMAAKVAYENENYIKNTVEQHWQMAYVEYYKCYNVFMNNYRTRAFICHDQSTNPDLIVVSFKGTSPFSALDWITDFDISYYEFDGIGKVHAGFMKALGLQKNGWPKDIPEGSPPYAYYTLREKLKELLGEHKEAKFAVTGHSLGGALAILFVAVLMFHEEKELLARMEGVYTFGQPRVGNAEFGEYMTRKLEEFDVRYHRYVYCNDIVPRLPFDFKALMYKQFGPCLYFNSCYKEKVLEEDPHKNYFLQMLNACWELVRGFILPYRYGPDYKENWVMKLARLVGLILPGFTDHIPLDYVNSTRLGLGHGRDRQNGPRSA